MGNTIFDQLFAELLRLLEPLLAASSEEGLTALLDGLGINLDVLGGGLTQAFGNAITDIDSAVSALENASAPESLSDVESAIMPAVNAIAAVTSLANKLESASTSVQLPPRFSDVLSALPGRLVDYLIGRWLLEAHPIGGQVLSALKVLEASPLPGNVIQIPAGVAYVPVEMTTLNYGGLFQLLVNPTATLKAAYLGGASGQAAVQALSQSLLPQIAVFLAEVGVPVTLGTDPQLRGALGELPTSATPVLGAAGEEIANAIILIPLGDQGGTALAGATNDASGLLTIGLVPPESSSPAALFADLSGAVSLGTTIGPWTFALSAEANGVCLAVDTSGSVTFLMAPGTTAQPALSATGSITNNGTPDNPVVLIGSLKGTRLEISTVTLTATVTATSQGASGPTKLGLTIEVDLKGIVLFIDLRDGDGLLAFVAGLCGDSVSVNADIGVGWSLGSGVFLHGGGSVGANGGQGLTASLPTNLDLGPVHIPAVNLGLTLPGTGIGTWAGPVLEFNLGPVGLAAFGFGLELDLSLGQSGSGNLGPFDFGFRLRPPTGASIGISAPLVSGSGAFNSPAPGQYEGAVSLEVGTLSIEGVGLLTTRSPSGASEFSLVVLASVGIPMVQIGFGFSLIGLGALVGVNRTINVPALQALARGGGLSQVLFPVDLAHTAPQVIASMESIFPTAQGQFIVGPAAQFTWGAGGFLVAEVGIWIELPSPLRIVLLGVLDLEIPPGEPIVDITLDILGVLDLSAETLSIDASLRGSSIAGFPLTGSGVLRAGWGANPVFLIALGGFYPSFVPPAGVPHLDRLALAIGGDDFRLTCSIYYAITSNTYQFGAGNDLYASAGPAVVSATFSYDVLLQLKPLKIEADLKISVSVSLAGWSALSISLELHLTGPSPWHVWGKASISILFFSVSIPISITIGPSATPLPPATVDIDGNLATALLDVHHWTFGPPPGAVVVVVKSGQDASAASAAVHPAGLIKVQQSAVPLDLPIDRYGPDLLDIPCSYRITAATVGANPVTITPTQDSFALAQFVTLSDAAKLSAPSFEPMDAGVLMAPAGFSAPAEGGNLYGASESQKFHTYTYGTAKVPATTAAPAGVVVGPASTTTAPTPDALLAAQAATSAVARANASAYGSQSAPNPIGLSTPSYVAASGLRAVSGTQSSFLATRTLAASGRGLQVIYSSEQRSTPVVSG